MKLTKTIFLYLNEKEFSMLTKDAERANMSMSRYIRHQIDIGPVKWQPVAKLLDTQLSGHFVSGSFVHFGGKEKFQC